MSQAGSFHRSGDSQLLFLLQLSPLFQLQLQPFSPQISSSYQNWFQDPGHALCAPKFSGKTNLKFTMPHSIKRNLISLVSSAKRFWVQQLVWQLTLTVFTSTGIIHASIANIPANTKGKSPST